MPHVPLESYRRVYPEWKPSTSLEKADIVSTIEHLAGMTCKFIRNFVLQPKKSLF